ncbi:heme peroxidase [Phlegmacium glaucopus]|nr:heme peroxidase [Phlegmacium glaucopus]
MQSPSLLPASEGDKPPLLSNGSSAGHHSDNSSSSRPEQKSGVLYLVKTTLAAQFGFFSHDSLKTVSTLITPVPTEVTAMQQMRSTSLFRQSSGVDDRSLAFQNGIKFMSFNPVTMWTESLQEAAMGHVLLHNSQPSAPGSGELTISRVTSSSTASRNLPAPEEVYRLLLRSNSNGSRTVHPYGVSSLVFAFASLISLSIQRPTSSQSTVNNQSPYFDLSPLYGFTSDDADQIRLKDGTGMLAPDCFCEDRVAHLPSAVSAMLILWNRNHNFIARRLSISYGDRFKESPQDSKDEHIFQTARLINCANFRNIIAIDFLKGLMGLSAADPNPNVDVLSGTVKVQQLKTFFESTFCYNWSSSMSKDDASLLEGTMARTLHLENGELANIHTGQFQSFLQTQTSEIDKDRTRRSYPGLSRPLNGRFKDEDIARVLQQATERTAGAFGYRQVPLCARVHELQKIEEARNSNVCSFNEYRKSLGLKPHKSFTDWNHNTEIAEQAEQLYKNIDNLELYVGIHVEEVVPCGFGLGHTMTYGLLTDLASRIRSDHANAKITEHTVTPWGYQDCQIHLHNGAFGNCFPKILLRNLPRHYPHNSVYSLFPFCTPRSAIECLTRNLQLPDEIDHSDYDYDTPKQPIVHTLPANGTTISHVLNAPDKYHTPYGKSLKKLTDGYGYFLGFDDEALHDRDQIMTLHALIPDSGSTLRQYAAALRKNTEEAIITKKQMSGMEKTFTIDIVKDVINPVCIRWVCQTLCDYKLRDNPQDIQRMSEEEMHEAFSALYTYIFRNSDPEQAWAIRREAMRARKILRDDIRAKITKPGWLKPSSHLMGPWLQTCSDDIVQYVGRVYKEFSLMGNILPAFTPQTFFERVVQARRISDLEPQPAHFDEIRNRVKAIDFWQNENDVKDQEIEDSRIVANVLGLSVLASVKFPLALIQAIDFYMDEKHKTEREEIIRLSNDGSSPPAEVNNKLMRYIREAQRIDQPLGLWRDVVKKDVIGGIHVHPGDRIFIDFQKAHNNPADFPKPHTIDVTRNIPSIHGLGLHKCPALSFVDQTMPEMFKVVFQLPNIRRVPGETGRLIKTKSRADPLDSDPVMFVNQAKELKLLPQNLILEYDANTQSPFGSEKAEMSAEEKKAWGKMTSAVTLHEVARQRMDLILKCIVIARLLWTLLSLLLSFHTAIFGMRSTKTVRPVTAEDIKHEIVLCPDPIKYWHNWEVAIMAAGTEGIPQPLKYISNNKTAHRLSVYDADKRDMRMAIYVDDILRGLTSEFDLNLEEDCGLDIYMCAQKGYSAGLLVIPPGKHEVRIEWNGKEYVNGTHEPDLGQDSSRRLFWERADCGAN